MKNTLNILAQIWAYTAALFALAALAFSIKEWLPDDYGDRDLIAGTMFLVIAVFGTLTLLTVAAFVQATADRIDS